MAPTNRRRFTGLLSGTSVPSLAAAISPTATTVTFPAALTYGGGQSVPTIADPDYIPFVVDPDKSTEEVVWLTAYTSGATTGTVVRGKEDTVAVAHGVGAKALHGPSANDLDYLSSSASASYTFVSGDLADPASWWGSPTFIHILPTWTPTVDGDMIFALGPDNGDSDWADNNFDVYIFKGAVANTDYPDGTAASGSWDGWNFDVFPAHPVIPVRVTAGQPYTIILVDWGGVAGHTIDLAGTYNSLFTFGGIDAAPPNYRGNLPTVLAAAPDGRLGRRFVIAHVGDAAWATVDNPTGSATLSYAHAEGVDTTASGYYSHAEGSGTTASGNGAHAEGENNVASGASSHAEGSGNIASGYFAHAEGQGTTASVDFSHAQGYTTRAGGRGAHASGFNATAWRPVEFAHGGGINSPGNNNPYQFSRLLLSGMSVAGGSTNLACGYGGAGPTTPGFPITPSTLCVIRGLVMAHTPGDVRAGWKYELVARLGSSGIAAVVVGTPTITSIAADAGASGWTVAITAVTDGLQMACTGSASETTWWAATAEILEAF
jgi:hypothetical protein